jgi:SpoVK/Ycf46/Vps4 family AAA+-type ATPase
MLRLLEYYSGILFLTTNRVESIDPAFQSRVTCALRYDPLTVEARAQIWATMLRQLDIDITTTDTDIDVAELAHADINGRQIKNTLQLAAALARHDRVPVGQAHLRETLAVTTSFLRETTNGGASTAVEL